jgi:hypothetical protein
MNNKIFLGILLVFLCYRTYAADVFVIENARKKAQELLSCGNYDVAIPLLKKIMRHSKEKNDRRLWSIAFSERYQKNKKERKEEFESVTKTSDTFNVKPIVKFINRHGGVSALCDDELKILIELAYNCFCRFSYQSDNTIHNTSPQYLVEIVDYCNSLISECYARNSIKIIKGVALFTEEAALYEDNPHSLNEFRFDKFDLNLYNKAKLTIKLASLYESINGLNNLTRQFLFIPVLKMVPECKSLLDLTTFLNSAKESLSNQTALSREDKDTEKTEQEEI